MPQTTATSNVVSEGDVLVSVAREAIIEHLTGKPSKEPLPEVTEYLGQERGVLVTLYDKKGEIRSRGGTTSAECANLIEETRQSAVAAASGGDDHDPIKDRRAFNRLRLEVTVLSPPERVDSIIELDPEIYGVILTAAKRGVRGIMMPNIPELNTVDKQLAAIRRNAGLRPDEHLRIERFRAEIFADPEE